MALLPPAGHFGSRQQVGVFPHLFTDMWYVASGYRHLNLWLAATLWCGGGGLGILCGSGGRPLQRHETASLLAGGNLQASLGEDSQRLSVIQAMLLVERCLLKAGPHSIHGWIWAHGRFITPTLGNDFEGVLGV